MTGRRKIQTAVDMVMMVLLFLLMPYSLIGEAFHEWCGIALFLFFILHHVLNRNWLKNIAKGKYTPFRIYNTVLDVLLFGVMFVLPVSGILMARYVFSFSFHVVVSRQVHLALSYWGFVLMGLHLGNHWHMAVGKLFSGKRMEAWQKCVIRMIPAVLSVYGGYVFIARDFLEYMFLKTRFVFLDFNEPIYQFLADYMAVMVLIVFAGYYISKTLRFFTGKLMHSEQRKVVARDGIGKERTSCLPLSKRISAGIPGQE